MRGLLAEKFGKEYALAAAENRDAKVSARVLDRLRVEPPKTELVEAYLSTIAEAYGVDYPPGTKAAKEAAANNTGAEDDDDDDDDEPGSGGRQRVLESPLNAEDDEVNALSRANAPSDLGPKSPLRVVPPKPSTDNVSPRVKLPGPPDLKPGAKMQKAQAAKKDGPGGAIPDVNELAQRFAQLKR